MSNKQAFADFDIAFRRNPVSGDLLRLNTEQSIKQSVRNLVLINFYEKHFRPRIGNFAAGSLFELADDNNILRAVKRSIKELLARFEPRIQVDEIEVSSDNQLDANSIRIKIFYKIIGMIGTQTTEIQMQRVR